MASCSRSIVELRKIDHCKVKYTAFTDEDGNYKFSQVDPGMYILTTYCPTDDGFFLKDVIEKEEGEELNAGIPDCDSIALALVIEYMSDTYCHCDPFCLCFPWKFPSTEYKLIQEIAEDIDQEIDIPAIISHEKFGDLCKDNADLVDLVCEKLQACCLCGAGQTDGNGDGSNNNNYTLTLMVNPENSGTVSGAGIYDEGSTVNILAVANSCWEFDDWTINSGTPGSIFNPNQASTKVLMNGNITLTANFNGSVPTADAGGPYGPFQVCQGTSAFVDLAGSGSGTGTLSYAWDLDNDGQYDDSTSQNPSKSLGAGQHSIGLKVTDACGSNDTDSAIITVHSPCDLPNTLNVKEKTLLNPENDPSANYFLRIQFDDGDGDIDSSTDYYGLCAHSLIVGTPKIDQNLFTYCTLDAGLGLADYWPKINWIINNRSGYTGWQVQEAIWHYINGNSVTGMAQTLIDQAESHGNYCPSIGNKFVGLLTPRPIDDSYYGGVYRTEINLEQPILIEVTRVNHCLD